MYYPRRARAARVEYKRIETSAIKEKGASEQEKKAKLNWLGRPA